MTKQPRKRARIAQDAISAAARDLGRRGGEARATALKDDPERRREIARSGGLAAAHNRKLKKTLDT